MPVITFVPIEDAYVSEFFPTMNFGGSEVLFVGQYVGPGDIYRSLLKFDISAIPQFSTIESATLRLFIYRNDVGAEVKPTSVFRALSNFGEDTVTFDNMPSVPVTPESTLNVMAEINVYLEWDITDLVKGWYDGSVPNNGIVIKGQESAPALIGFRSKEFGDSSNWPLLEVSFSSGVLTSYPVKMVTTGDSYAGSTAIPLGARRLASFGVVNTSALNSATVKVQLSPDGINWVDDSAEVVILAGNSTVLNTTGAMEFARLAYKSTALLLPANLQIYPSTAEP